MIIRTARGITNEKQKHITAKITICSTCKKCLIEVKKNTVTEIIDDIKN